MAAWAGGGPRGGVARSGGLVGVHRLATPRHPHRLEPARPPAARARQCPTVDARLLVIATRDGGLVLSTQARAAGVPVGVVRWAVHSGELVRVAPGAYVPRPVWEPATSAARHLLLLRAALHRSPRAVAAGSSAAVVWGLPLPSAEPRAPVLVTPRTATRPQYGGRSPVATSRRAWLSPDEVTSVRSIPVTRPERTFVDLSRTLDLPWSLAVADAVRRLHRVSREELVAAAARNPRAPGHRRALTAAQHAEHLVESPLESLARGVQIQLGLPVPRVQVWVGRDRAEFRVDMLVDEHATVVEADGRLKYDGPDAAPDARWAEKRRQDRLLDLGYDCHRFVAADAHRPQAWGQSLLRTFHRSHRRRGLPPPTFTFPWC